MQEGSAVQMLYKVAEGSVQDLHYGLALAEAVGLPDGLLERAREVAETLTRRREEGKRRGKAWGAVKMRGLVLRLLETLVQAREGRMEGVVLRRWLEGVQADFVERMDAFRREAEGEGEEEEDGEMEEDEVEEEQEEEMMEDETID